MSKVSSGEKSSPRLPISPPLLSDELVKVDTFPSKTHHMIEHCDSNDSSVACWSEDGDSFIVKDSITLSMSYLPEYFKHSNFQSFVRQLNLYGFRSIRVKEDRSTRGPARGPQAVVFRHEFFQKGRKDLLPRVQRAKKGEKAGQKAGPKEREAAAIRKLEGPVAYDKRFDKMEGEFHSLGSQIQQMSSKLDRLIQLMTFNHTLRVGPVSDDETPHHHNSFTSASSKSLTRHKKRRRVRNDDDSCDTESSSGTDASDGIAAMRSVTSPVSSIPARHLPQPATATATALVANDNNSRRSLDDSSKPDDSLSAYVDMMLENDGVTLDTDSPAPPGVTYNVTAHQGEGGLGPTRDHGQQPFLPPFTAPQAATYHGNVPLMHNQHQPSVDTVIRAVTAAANNTGTLTGAFPVSSTGGTVHRNDSGMGSLDGLDPIPIQNFQRQKAEPSPIAVTSMQPALTDQAVPDLQAVEKDSHSQDNDDDMDDSDSHNDVERGTEVHAEVVDEYPTAQTAPAVIIPTATPETPLWKKYGPFVVAVLVGAVLIMMVTFLVVRERNKGPPPTPPTPKGPPKKPPPPKQPENVLSTIPPSPTIFTPSEKAYQPSLSPSFSPHLPENRNLFDAQDFPTLPNMILDGREYVCSQLPLI